MKVGQFAYFDTRFQGLVPIRLVARQQNNWLARVTRRHRGFKRGEIVEIFPADVKPRL